MTTEDAIKNQLTGDERAVSPVIGVILMVAITVILAAVIGTFVLDLGQSAGQAAPAASLSVVTNTAANNTTISHSGGDALSASDTRVVVTDGSNTLEFTASGQGTLAVGNEVVINTNDTTTSDWSQWDSTFSRSSGTEFSFTTGAQITVQVIDTASQKIIYETTVTA